MNYWQWNVQFFMLLSVQRVGPIVLCAKIYELLHILQSWEQGDSTLWFIKTNLLGCHWISENFSLNFTLPSARYIPVKNKIELVTIFYYYFLLSKRHIFSSLQRVCFSGCGWKLAEKLLSETYYVSDFFGLLCFCCRAPWIFGVVGYMGF